MATYKRIGDLVRKFKHPDRDSYIYAFFDINHFNVEMLKIEEAIKMCRKNNISCIIPSISDGILPSKGIFKFLADFYGRLIPIAKENNVKVGLNLQRVIEKSYFLREDCDKEILANVLTRLEYYHGANEHIHKNIDMNTNMAITAYDEMFGERINLTSKTSDGVLDYTLPDGNWIVNYYVCEKKDLEFDREPTCVNRLSKEAYTKYINYVIDLLGDTVKNELGKAISLLYVPELCFDAPNRRDWDPGINERFINEYNAEPYEFYDSLYTSIGEITANVKSCLLTVRAEMFREGVISSIRDFAASNNIEHIYSMCEPKIPAGAWLFGDAIKNASDCAVLDKAYMYGTNSIKLAIPATENTDGKRIYCDIFRGYYKNSVEIAYNETINAYAQGVNRLLVHAPNVHSLTPREKSIYKIKKNDAIASFCDFVASAQSVLSLGKCVSDIAILYPVNAIQANVNFYQRNETKFEYPPYQVQNDYMTLMSILSVNCGQDAMYIHPDDLTNNCRVDGKRLIFEKTGMECRILFLPGANITSLKIINKVKEFYDAGGTVVATVMLPKYAKQTDLSDDAMRGEYNFLGEYVNKNDAALMRVFSEIFGDDATNPNVIRPYFLNTNGNGGRAYYIPPSKTAADGSLHVQPSLIKQLVEEADTPLDLYMTNLPKMMNTNGYNTTFYDFKGLGMHKEFPYGGLVNNIHKKIDELDLLFFSNTSSEEYHGFAFIKGKLKARAFNPYDKKRNILSSRYVNFKGCVYTAIDMHLRQGECKLILGKIKQEAACETNGYPNIKYLEYNFMTE